MMTLAIIVIIIAFFIGKNVLKGEKNGNRTSEAKKTVTNENNMIKNDFYALCVQCGIDTGCLYDFDPLVKYLTVKGNEQLIRLINECKEGSSNTNSWGALGKFFFYSGIDQKFEFGYEEYDQLTAHGKAVGLAILNHGLDVESVSAISILAEIFEKTDEANALKLYKKAMELGGEKERYEYAVEVRAAGLKRYEYRNLAGYNQRKFDPDKATICFREAVKNGSIERDTEYDNASRHLTELLFAELIGTRERYPDGKPDNRFFVENPYIYNKEEFLYDKFYQECNEILLKKAIERGQYQSEKKK